MSSITIIGLGWLGMPLAERLQQQGWQVKGTKRRAEPNSIECLPFELTAFCETDLAPLLASDVLFINIPPSGCTPDEYANGIKRLVSTAILQNVRHIMFISSTSVLPMRSGNFDETSEIDAENWLGHLEKWLLAQPVQMDVLRLAGLVGKKRHPVFYLAGKRDLKGAVQPVNLVHLSDCLSAITLLLAKPNGQRLYHLCASEHPTRQTYYTEMAKRFGLPDLHFSAENHPLVRIISATRICDELGFVYRYNDPYQFDMEI